MFDDYYNLWMILCQLWQFVSKEQEKADESISLCLNDYALYVIGIWGVYDYTLLFFVIAPEATGYLSVQK